MKKSKKQRMSIYFPLDMLQMVRKSSDEHKRSFNMEVLWMVQQSLENQTVAGDGKHVYSKTHSQ